MSTNSAVQLTRKALEAGEGVLPLAPIGFRECSANRGGGCGFIRPITLPWGRIVAASMSVGLLPPPRP